MQKLFYQDKEAHFIWVFTVQEILESEEGIPQRRSHFFRVQSWSIVLSEKHHLGQLVLPIFFFISLFLLFPFSY